ncbi:MAG: ABC transporter ATP-binding protein [Bacillota bacterium]
MLEVRGLTKSFGKLTAVSDVSFQVRQGEAFGLLGPNGAGKSTIISMLFGLLQPEQGEILIVGQPLWEDPIAAKRLLGYVPQEIALYPELSAQENLVFWGRLYGLVGAQLKERVAHVLDVVGLSERARGRVSTFSGGMKRRINIAAALLHQPRLLIMDEPTVGIDPQSRNHILETVRRLNQEGMTIIYTSHYMEEVEYLCSRIGIIDHGKIIALGTVPELRQIVGEDSQIAVTVQGLDDQGLAKLSQLEHVRQAKLQEDQLLVVSPEPALALGAISTLLAACDVKMRSIRVTEPNLETVFLHLTGRALRD